MTETLDRPMVTMMPVLAAGDDVMINHPSYAGQVWTVKRVKVSKAILFPKGQPGHRGLDAPMSLLVKVDAAAMGAGDVPVMPVPVPVPVTSAKPGNVVRVLRPFGSYRRGDLCVVAKVNSATTTLHRLGGDRPGERGVNFYPASFEVVDLAEAVAQMAAEFAAAEAVSV